MSSKRSAGVTLHEQPGTKGLRSAAPKIVFTSLVLSLLPLASCGDDSPVAVMVPHSDARIAARMRVADLRVAASTESTLTIEWTQIDDGKGEPAWYRVKYARPPIEWTEADIGCDSTIPGDEIGAPMSCTIQGLEQATDYEVQMMSYRIVNGRWSGSQYSNVAAGRTASGVAASVDDLAVVATTERTLTAEWTQVDDGTGDAASYRVKHAVAPIDWKVAEIGCEQAIPEDEVGARMTCVIEGLEPATQYEVQLMSYRLEDGSWRGAVHSNVAGGRTRALAALQSVGDLHVTATTESTATVEWTQVDDGAGGPGVYELKYASPPIDWPSALEGCDGAMPGDEVGRTMSCTVSGLSAETTYDLQLSTYRIEDGTPVADRLSNVASATTIRSEPVPPPPPASVQDLTVTATSASTVSVQWTQIDDGTGSPAMYRLKYDVPPLDWPSAAIGCASSIEGTAIGVPISCTVTGLEPGTAYDLQLMSYRTVDGVWADALYSNVTTATTGGAPAPSPSSDGIWISPAEIAALPMSGAAWESLLSAANGSCGTPDLSDQEQSTNVCVMAKALVFARTGDASYRGDVVSALQAIAYAGTYVGRSLALGRELGAYVIAADLIDLETHNPALDALFRITLAALRTAYTSGAAANLIECHEKRPNNWGTHCGATRAAIAVYLGDTSDLARTAQVFKGYLGDRAAYAGFVYGADLSWQCDPSRPVGVNPAGCGKNGLSIDGVLPDDQRRGGSFTTSPPKENYVWEGLQGALAQAVILHRAGYPAFEWEGRALLRAVRWLHEQIDYPAQGDDTWQPYIVNRYYGTTFPTVSPARYGKNVGWTDWTHR